MNASVNRDDKLLILFDYYMFMCEVGGRPDDGVFVEVHHTCPFFAQGDLDCKEYCSDLLQLPFLCGCPCDYLGMTGAFRRLHNALKREGYIS